MSNQQVIIIGAGGHAKVVLSTLLAAGHTVAGFLDDDETLIGKSICQHPVIGTLDQLHFFSNPLVFGIGDNHLRKELKKKYASHSWCSVIHPQAIVHSSTKIGEGTVIFAGTVIQPDVVIGEHVIINTAVTIDHDSRIGDFSHLAPGTHTAGNVTIQEGCFLGIGCTVIPGMNVGAWSKIGAGSVIVNDIAAFSHAKGLPARTYCPKEV